MQTQINMSGSSYYYNDIGQLHRIDGPAIEYGNDSKFWYQNNQLHRLDGPACEYSDGRKNSFFINGKHYSEEQFSAWQSHFWNLWKE